MIAKTQDEKDAVKAAKKAYKLNDGRRRFLINAQREENERAIERLKKAILTGITPKETELEDDFPVHFDFKYVVSDNGGKVINSDIKGTVRHLKADLRRRGYKAERIYACDLIGRKML